MDIFLLFITIVSLGVAVIMSVVAWRLTREERARSAARIAALAAAASDDRAAEVPTPEPTEVVVRPIPWRASEPARAVPQPKPRREPRETLATSLDEFVIEKAGAESGRSDMGESFLGSAVAAPPSGGRQRGLAIAAAVLFFVIVTGGYFTIYGDKPGAVTAAAQSSTAAPLELISLRHERQDGALAITGLVKNPSAGARIEGLSAVAFLFDGQGAFLTSSRAGVDFTQLAPGDESPFVIRIASAPKNVARYRVSFRTDAGVVPHVDRRGQEPIAREMP